MNIEPLDVTSSDEKYFCFSKTQDGSLYHEGLMGGYI